MYDFTVAAQERPKSDEEAAMKEPPLVSDIETLRRINLQLVDWELHGPNAPRDQVAEVLDERFLFRRAKGDVDREGFLAGLADPKNQSREISGRIGQIQVLGDQAFVEIFVFLDGLRGGDAVKGWFRNIRVWEKQSDDCWRCVFWFNKQLAS